MTRPSVVALGVCLGLVSACASEKSGRDANQAAAPAAAPPSTVSQESAAPAGARPSAPPPPPPASPPRTADLPSDFAPPPARGAALIQASRDLETSYRELDLARGDCEIACHALG